jgi:hypothetical protein
VPITRAEIVIPLVSHAMVSHLLIASLALKADIYHQVNVCYVIYLVQHALEDFIPSARSVRLLISLYQVVSAVENVVNTSIGEHLITHAKHATKLAMSALGTFIHNALFVILDTN